MCSIAVIISLVSAVQVRTTTNVWDRLIDRSGARGWRGIPPVRPFHNRWFGRRKDQMDRHRRNSKDAKIILRSGSGNRLAAARQEEKVLDSIKALEQQAPLLSDPEFLSDEVIYSCPLDYCYGTESVVGSDDGMFTSKIKRNAFVGLMEEIRLRLSGFEGSTLKVIRNFQPEPNLFICRWNFTVNKRASVVPQRYGLGVSAISSNTYENCERAIILGISRYFLKAGKVYMIQESWETDPKDYRGSSPGLMQTVFFSLSRRPQGQPDMSLSGFLPAFKYEAWEDQKNEEGAQKVLGKDGIYRIAPYVLYASLFTSIAVPIWLVSSLLNLF